MVGQPRAGPLFMAGLKGCVFGPNGLKLRVSYTHFPLFVGAYLVSVCGSSLVWCGWYL